MGERLIGQIMADRAVPNIKGHDVLDVDGPWRHKLVRE